jgi:hypothetical protein
LSILTILLLLYSIGWEISTRRYLRGFSDAIVPSTAPADEKIEAILNWMTHGPARLTNAQNTLGHDRDPTETLNYEVLLRVCGTATNAFINLMDSDGLPARRLLLLDENRLTKHATAEVLVNGRWIVVDAAYRVVLRGSDGKLLTREELADPAVFSAATRGIPRYDPSYTFENTSHIRVPRLPLVGHPLQAVLDLLLPGWEDSTTTTLLLERESFFVMSLAIILVFSLGLLRVSIRWYGERWLGIQQPRVRDQLLRATQAFFNIPN